MSQINIRNLSNENDDGSPEIVGVSTFSATSFFVPPKGTTAERPSDCEPGSIRFNTDTANLEYFRGKTIGWSQFELKQSAPLGGRGVYALGYAPSISNKIDFLTIATEGNAKDFGDLTVARGFLAAAGSKTRAVFSRAYTGSQTNVLDFVTIANQGDALDFGDATTDAHSPAGCGDSTRGLFGGGTPAINTLEFFTFDSTGNATDFGDLYSRRDMGACSSSTRGIFAQGSSSPYPGSNTIQFVTISTTGNTSDFGDLNFNGYRGASCSSNIRAVIVQGTTAGAGQTNAIDFITIATTGNGTDFGDKTTASNEMSESGTSNAHGGL